MSEKFWPNERGSIDEAAYETTQGATLEYRELWCQILIDRAVTAGLAAGEEAQRELVKALEYVRDSMLELPGGINDEAEETEACPEDMVAHIGGLVWQRMTAVLRRYEATP